MKKWVVIFLSLSMLLGIAACGTDSPEMSDITEESSVQQTSHEAVSTIENKSEESENIFR